MKAGYDRRALKTGIVHLGLGAFHRAHQAVYTDAVLQKFGADWGICGVSLRGSGVRDALAENENAYTVAVRSSEGTTLSTIGALTRVLVAPEDPLAVIDAIADPEVRVVTLTITEKGYCLAPATGRLDAAHVDIVHDLANPTLPRTAMGYLAAGLAERQRRSAGGLTLISCDNLAGNGDKLKGAILDLTAARDKNLAAWIEQHCRFPNSMVDRIVPASTDADIDEIAAQLGRRDPAAVVTEPFSQWMIERNFAAEIPPWQAVGVQYVESVAPYERMKLRLLNASHSSMAYLGSLAGYGTVHEVIANPAFKRLIQQLMAVELAPTLSGLADFDLSAYQQSLIDRFGNRNLPHQTRQIAMDGSRKIPERLLPPIAERLAANEPIEAASCGLAGWISYTTGVDHKGASFTVNDPLSEDFASHYRASQGNLEGYLNSILQMSEIFPAELQHSSELRSNVLGWLQKFQKHGVRQTVQSSWGENP